MKDMTEVIARNICQIEETNFQELRGHGSEEGYRLKNADILRKRKNIRPQGTKLVLRTKRRLKRTEHTSLYERSDLRDLYQLMWISQHKMKMFSPSHALLVIFEGGGQGAGEGIRIWMYIYTYIYIFMVGPLCCIEQTISGHFSIFKNTFWQFKWITPSHFQFGPTTAFLFLILYVSP